MDVTVIIPDAPFAFSSIYHTFCLYRIFWTAEAFQPALFAGASLRFWMLCKKFGQGQGQIGSSKSHKNDRLYIVFWTSGSCVSKFGKLVDDHDLGWRAKCLGCYFQGQGQIWFQQMFVHPMSSELATNFILIGQGMLVFVYPMPSELTADFILIRQGMLVFVYPMSSELTADFIQTGHVGVCLSHALWTSCWFHSDQTQKM